MKIPKDALRTARQLIRATVREGAINGEFAKAVVTKLASEKPRNYLAILSAYQRLIRLEAAQRHAIVESAQVLNPGDQEVVLIELKKKYGQDVTAEYKVNAELISGMRVRLGSHVWDGTVKARLEALREKVLA
jgi:F-type H+-transporting ATPase subunit delta